MNPNRVYTKLEKRAIEVAKLLRSWEGVMSAPQMRKAQRQKEIRRAEGALHNERISRSREVIRRRVEANASRQRHSHFPLQRIRDRYGQFRGMAVT